MEIEDIGEFARVVALLLKEQRETATTLKSDVQTAKPLIKPRHGTPEAITPDHHQDLQTFHDRPGLLLESYSSCCPCPPG